MADHGEYRSLQFVFVSGRRPGKSLRVQVSQQAVDLHVPDEDADGFDLCQGVIRKFSAGELFLDQYQQLESIEGIKIKIVSKVRFICNSFDINT